MVTGITKDRAIRDRVCAECKGTIHAGQVCFKIHTYAYGDTRNLCQSCLKQEMKRRV